MDLIKHYNIKDNLSISYPIKLEFQENNTEEIKLNENMEQPPIQILAQENYSNFILSMLESFPPFTSIDYKEVLEEFYKKIKNNYL